MPYQDSLSFLRTKDLLLRINGKAKTVSDVWIYWERQITGTGKVKFTVEVYRFFLSKTIFKASLLPGELIHCIWHWWFLSLGVFSQVAKDFDEPLIFTPFPFLHKCHFVWVWPINMAFLLAISATFSWRKSRHFLDESCGLPFEIGQGGQNPGIIIFRSQKNR